METYAENGTMLQPDPALAVGPLAPRNSFVAAPVAARRFEPPRGRRLERALVVGILVVLGALLAASIVGSLGWRMKHDLPLSQYSAFMHLEHGTTPYRGLFEISFPGTLLFHLAIARLLGFSDRALMIANLVWFVALAAATYKLMAPFGRLVAATALLASGAAYFGCDAGMVLQRDCVLILPVALALVVHCHPSLPPWIRRGVVGALVGCATTMKPHAALALLPLIANDWLESRAARRFDGGAPSGAARAASAYACGFAVPWACALGWLAATGGLGAWWEMVREYLPLYLQLDGTHATTTGIERLRHVARGLLEFGGHSGYFVAAGVGSLLALRVTRLSSRSAKIAGLLLAEAVVFAVYPAFAGQFWDYHYLPFVYFLALLASLCLLPVHAPANLGVRLLPRLALVLTLVQVTKVAHSLEASLAGGAEPAVKQGQVDEIAAFLRSNLRPGDTVQPLDWTGGVVHAMLIARAPLATRFMYDFHLYHHVSQLFVQLLRRRFFDEFESSKPRFVIEYFGNDKPWPRGVDTTRDFPKLQQILATEYSIRSSSAKYRIHERLGGA